METDKLKNLVEELQCVGMELANIEAELSKIRGEMAKLSFRTRFEPDYLAGVKA